jgi:ATP-dependent DNA ligase
MAKLSAAVCEHGFEGVVAKRANSTYTPESAPG